MKYEEEKLLIVGFLPEKMKSNSVRHKLLFMRTEKIFTYKMKYSRQSQHYRNVL
jgi:hypothetical protein